MNEQEQPLLRIRNKDKFNWTIERFQSDGIISRGKYKGQEMKAKWQVTDPVGYYPTLKEAARGLLDTEFKQDWPEDGMTGEDITALIEAAEIRVMAAVADASNTFQKQLKEK